MGGASFIVIVVLEALALSALFIAFLLLRNRKLRRLVERLQAKMEELVVQLREARRKAKTPPAAPEPEPESYMDKLEHQLELTQSHHRGLGSHQDIALDLDPDTPMPRRAAALRHALLIAEREAVGGDENQPDWDALARRYQQLIAYTQDYQPQSENADDDDELTQLKEDITQAQKRINNLERFKVLYFELEERWEQCKSQASDQYSELQALVAQQGDEQALQNALSNYHRAYAEIGNLIERGASESTTHEHSDNKSHLAEIQRLRSVAADQHRIITELQGKLHSSTDHNEQVSVVTGLQSELKKQERFLKESETCIQLMEDELATANAEIEQLRSRVKQMPELKSQVKEMARTADKNEQIVGSLKQENRRLAQKLQLAQDEPASEGKQARELRKELSELQNKYNDLEEKYLDLKLQD